MSGYLLPPEAIVALKDGQSAQWISAGGVTLFFYDWLLCLDGEIGYIWKARWSVGKILFFLQRYGTMFVCLESLYEISSSGDTISLCRLSLLLQTYSSAAVIAIIQLTMLIRVYALYRRNKVVLICLSTLLVACDTITITLLTIVTKQITFKVNPLSTYINACNIECEDCHGKFVNIYTPILAFDFIIVVMTIYQAYVSSLERAMAPTLTVLYRDGLLYFVVICCAVLINVLFLSLGQGGEQAWFIPYMRALLSSMATRLLLNLHRQMDRKHRATYRSTTLACETTGFRMAQDPDALFDTGSERPPVLERVISHVSLVEEDAQIFEEQELGFVSLGEGPESDVSGIRKRRPSNPKDEVLWGAATGATRNVQVATLPFDESRSSSGETRV